MEGSEGGDRGDEGAPPPGQPRLISLVAVAGAVILIGLVSFALYRRSHSTPPVAEPAPVAGEPAAGQEPGTAATGTPLGGTPIAAPLPVRLSPEASIVAERYRCICSCNDPLNVCTCTRTPGSRDMKLYVQELVNQKKSGKEVDQAMIARYGAGVLLTNPPPLAAATPESRKR
ncbi:MAG TPA: cytochrome c-type biogenesis protein CcmH [Candidatus Polarisedimenticolia bacterium]|nr:cytochrome c-type biogenesis protein CcmH [Candidatus Polarisedimenticolia bacterium]